METDKLNNLSVLYDTITLKRTIRKNTIFFNDKKNLIKIIFIIFKDNHDNKVEIIANKGKTIKYLIEKYLKIINHIELIEEERKDEVQYVYKQNILEFNDNTTMEDFFQNDNNPIIQVNDFDGMFLSNPITKYYITFETSQGYSFSLESFLGTKLERIITNYLTYIEHPELINKDDNIIFLYNGNRIDKKITARKCFKNEENPKIIVMDTSNQLKYNDNNFEKKININFEYPNKNKTLIIARYGMTIDTILKKYILKADLTEYINDNKLIFLLNGKEIYLGEQTFIEKFCENNLTFIEKFCENTLNIIVFKK